MWRSIPRILIRTGLALVGGAIFYALWLVVFLFAGKWEIIIVNLFLWFLAPVVTAAGFAGAVFVLESYGKETKVRFLSVYGWALTGCVSGVLVVVWFGPMLIVFGMLSAGMLAMGLREVFYIRQQN